MDSIKELAEINIAELDTKNGHKGKLKLRIKELLGVHEATEQEIEQVYNHILMEMLGEKDVK